MSVPFFCFLCPFSFDFQYVPTRELGKDSPLHGDCESGCRAVNLGEMQNLKNGERLGRERTQRPVFLGNCLCVATTNCCMLLFLTPTRPSDQEEESCNISGGLCLSFCLCFVDKIKT